MGTRIAGLYVVQGTNVNSISTMEQLTQWEIEADAGLDAQLETDAIRVLVPGLHQAYASLSFKGDVGVTYFAELRVNGNRVGSGLLASQTANTAGGTENMLVFGGGVLNAGDLVSIYVGSDQVGGANFQLVYGQFGLFSA